MYVIHDWFGYDIPTAERHRLIKKTGFDGVMLFWGGESTDYRNSPFSAKEAGLFIENVHAPFENINDLWFDNLNAVSIFTNLLQCIKDCANFEIPTVVLHPKRRSNSCPLPPPFNEIGFNRIMKLTEKAEQLRINLAFENIRENDFLDLIFSKINSPRVGFCYDSGHHNCWTPNEDLLSKYGNRLMALHFHDNDGCVKDLGKADQHKLPFDGTISWERTIKKIFSAGYRGAITLEVEKRNNYDLTAEEFLQIAFERAKRLDAYK